MFPKPVPKFKVGDVVGNNLDGTRIIYRVTVAHGDFTYHTLRTDPDDIRINGKTANYSRISIEKHFKWLRYEPSVELLYGKSE